jgi:GTP-binding protein
MKIKSIEFLGSVYPKDDFPPDSYPEVAFAGRSNVGKSSLINTLVNRKGLARTSSSPGKTQSINFYLVNRAVSLVDLPGYGYAKVQQKVRKRWSPLIEKYCRTRKNLQGVVVIIDARIGPIPLDLALIAWLKGIPVSPLFTITKIDKLSKNKVAKALQQTAQVLAIPPDVIIPFSAHTGEGKKELWQGIARVLKIHDIINVSKPFKKSAS